MLNAVRVRPFGLIVAVTLVAVLIGSMSVWRATAAVDPKESTFVPVTPTRILDTRDPINVGLDGPFVSAVSQKLQVTGAVPTTEGTQTVVPVGATGVALNVTVALPTAAGFVSIRPGDASGAPATSSLNFEAGVVQPNAVTVELPTSGPGAGMIDITFDAYGVAGPTTDMLIDVVGFTTNTGIQELVAELATKANIDDVYTKNQSDAALATKADATDVYTKGEVDAAIADGPMMGTFGSAIPNPFPTGQGVIPSATFTTAMTSRLHLTVHVGMGMSCSAGSLRHVWLELDGQPLPSSIIWVGGLGDVFSPLSLTGITSGSVPAGAHTLTVRQACSSGSSTGSSTAGMRGIFAYIADDDGPSPATAGTLDSRSATACDPPAVEPEPGLCVLTES